MLDPHINADVIVVGLGAVGSALVLHLARQGVKVVGIDRFDPPHDQGSSHGRTRITRLAVGEGEAFVPLVQRSHALWRRFEAETGERLMQTTGLLVVGAPAGDTAAYHGQAGFFARTRSIAQRFGIEHEMLSPAAVRARFPAFLPGDDEHAYYEPEGGVLFPEACIRVQLMLAERAGARLLRRCRMQGVTPEGGGVAVQTDAGVLHADRAVLCTGAWLPGQAGGLPRLRVLRQVLHWVEPEVPAWFDAGAFPAFLWLHGPDASDAFYGFPRVDGQPGVKLATEQFTQLSDPDHVDRTVAPAAEQALLDDHVAGRLRGLAPRVLASTTCLYTMADDGNFVIAPHPDTERITLVSACSGHGFKHSAALGESLAQHITGQPARCDLGSFIAPR